VIGAWQPLNFYTVIFLEGGGGGGRNLMKKSIRSIQKDVSTLGKIFSIQGKKVI
jgi:hypothetical protein